MGKEIFIVGNKVDLPKDNDISVHDSENVLLFVGKMNYEPNVVAVTSFVERIFPKLKDVFKNIRFMIVGAHPDKRVQNLAKDPQVEVTGFVKELEPYFQHATIVVAPMLTGAGIQNKIIQAMSYACCVVTTPIGAEGLDILNNELAIFPNEDDMTQGIIDLLRDREQRVKMGMSARKYVMDNLSKEVVATQFWRFIDGQ